MKNKIIIAIILLIMIGGIFLSIKASEARTINCGSWAKIKLCYDDDPDNDPDCCRGGTPKDEMNQQ